jgi:hypothetical protein
VPIAPDVVFLAAPAKARNRIMIPHYDRGTNAVGKNSLIFEAESLANTVGAKIVFQRREQAGFRASFFCHEEYRAGCLSTLPSPWPQRPATST